MNWRTEREYWNDFIKTPVGAAFAEFERLHAWACQKDTALAYTNHGDKGAKEAWKKSDEARRKLLSILGYPPMAKSEDSASVDARNDIRPSDHQEGESPSANKA